MYKSGGDLMKTLREMYTFIQRLDVYKLAIIFELHWVIMLSSRG
jgi:hypothetical protein